MTDKPGFVTDCINLAAREFGGAICSVSDEFFAPAKRMLSDQAPIFIPDKFDRHGKWMDGWESRRKRTAGHDFCVLRICPGVIRGVEVDTSYFTGNFAPAVSIEACRVDIEPDEHTQWSELIPRSDLEGDSQRYIAIANENIWSHIRLNIYPDGGIARFKVFGEAERQESASDRDQWVDLASVAVGGRALECNNEHFGNMHNLLSVNPIANMGDGWETRRRRHPGNDWVILKLGRKGCVSRVEVDTTFFRGNYPARCSLRGASPDNDTDLGDVSAGWDEILPQVSLGPDQAHVFESQLRDIDSVTHVRLDIYPDGGVARLRLRGVPSNHAERET